MGTSTKSNTKLNKKKEGALARSHSRLVHLSRRNGMLLDQLRTNSTTEIAEPAAEALISSPEGGSEDSEMHEARVLRQRSHSRLLDPSRRNGMTPEQFASFRDRGRFPELPRSPAKAERPLTDASKVPRSRLFSRGGTHSTFQTKCTKQIPTVGT